MVRLLAACLGLATLSLLLPSELSYDPLAWVVWGREIAHLGLDTSGGPSWKPLRSLTTRTLPSASGPVVASGELEAGEALRRKVENIAETHPDAGVRRAAGG